MRDLYETEYKIFNHRIPHKQRPLASVAFHPAESINEDSIFEDSIRTYLSRGIKDKYGLTLIEFLELPTDIINVMLKVSDESLAKQAEEVATLERHFKT